MVRFLKNQELGKSRITLETHDRSDARVTLSDGSVTRLSELWQNGPLVLVFLRHFGWPFCREQVAQLSARHRDFEKAGARVVLVGMGTPGECAAFQKKFHVPFQMISDPDRTIYRQFHLQRMSPLGVFSPAVALKGIAAIARGHNIGKPQGDVLQLPGVFVISTDGRIIFNHQPDNPAGHAALDPILEALARLG